MYLYVISKEKCAVGINGTIVGTADGNVRRFRHCGKNLTISFIPDDKNFTPSLAYFPKVRTGYFGDVMCVKTPDGYLIFPLFGLTSSQNVKKIFGKSFPDKRTTVLISADPFYKITILSDSDFFLRKPLYLCDCADIDCKMENDLLFLRITSKYDHLYVFDCKDRIKELAAEEIRSLDFTKDSVTVTKKPVGLTGCFIKETHSLNDYSVLQKTRERNRPVYMQPKELLPCAFLDELKADGDYADFLSASLKNSKELIPEFFGDFLFYIPFFTNGNLRVALVYDTEVKQISFTLDAGGAISDFAFI